jgi:hypothetical protein
VSGLPKPSIVAECMAMVAPAELAFTSRWRLSTLKRLDPELHQLLAEQIDLYERSLVTGSDDETREQSAAMVRGWRAACARMEIPLQPDDAYFAGYDEMTMTKVIIGPCARSIARVQHIAGQHLIMITPDEVARLIGGMGALVEVKAIFPDAEILPAQEAQRT